MDMSTMKEKITGSIKEELIQAVNTYFLTRAYAETITEKVDALYAELLKEFPLYSDKHDDGQQIVSRDRMYLSDDDATCQKIWDEADSRLRKLNLKPDDMEKDFCPALVAKHDLIKIERAIMEIGDKFTGIDSKQIYNMDHRQRYIDLLVGLTCSLPNYKKPKL